MRIHCAALLLTLIPLAVRTEAQAIRPLSRLTVVDANNKVVADAIGVRVGEGITAAVAFDINGQTLVFRVTTDALIGSTGSGSGYVFFESIDCTGSPLVSGGDFPIDLAPRTTVRGPGQTVYVPTDANEVPTLLTTRSSRPPVGTNGYPCVQSEGSSLLIHATALLDFESLFTPPFRLTASATSSAIRCCGDCNGDGAVTVDELVTAVNYALGTCPSSVLR